MPSLNLNINTIASGAKSLTSGAGDSVDKLLTMLTAKFKPGKPTNLMKLASDSILQYPAIVSNAVSSPDTVAVIAKAFEKQCAANFMVMISARNSYDTRQYADAIQYIKAYQDNSDEIQISEILASIKESYTVSQDVIEDCWSCVDNEVTTESLNSLYFPFNKYASAVESAVDKLKTHNATPVMEAGHDPGKHDTVKGVGKTSSTSIEYTDKEGGRVKRIYGAPVGPKAPIASRDDILGKMAPTIVEVEFVRHGANVGPMKAVKAVGREWSDTVGTQTVLIGFKTMVHRLPSNVMVSNLVQAVTDGNPVFKFIKWTKGELKLADWFFGISDARIEALQNRTSSRIFSALKKRRRTGAVKEGVVPSSIIVVTEYEIEEVRSLTSIDLHDPTQASKLLDQLYLLAIVIVDEQAGMISTLFNGAKYYMENSIASLDASNKRQSDVMNIKDVMQLMGRKVL